MITVRCPKCRNKMKYQAKGLIAKKRKRCVYCGFSIGVKKNIIS